MPRTARSVEGGYVYHVLNRGKGRGRLFRSSADFAAFEGLLAEALQRFPDVELLTYCLMPSHWHLVLRPRKAMSLGRFMRWVGVTHVRRHHARSGKGIGGGNLYHGRYKSFPVQADDEHLPSLCRFVESNPRRNGLVRRAEQWQWCGLAAWLRERAGGKRERGATKPKTTPTPATVVLSKWPVKRPANWLALVNEPLNDAETERLRTSVVRGRPYGTAAWTARTAARQGLEFTLRPRGRPRKSPATPSAKPPSRRGGRGRKHQP